MRTDGHGHSRACPPMSGHHGRAAIGPQSLSQWRAGNDRERREYSRPFRGTGTISKCPGFTQLCFAAGIAVSRQCPGAVSGMAEIRAFSSAGTNRDKPGHCFRVPPKGTGTTGTRALGRVPMSRPRGHLPRTGSLSLNQNAGPCHRGAVGGTLSRFISIGANK